MSVKRKDRLRVRLEVVPHFHSHSSSGAHALSVTVTSVPPPHSCTRLWRRSALLTIHTWPRHLRISEWTAHCADLKRVRQQEEEEEEEARPCLAASERIRFPIMLVS